MYNNTGNFLICFAIGHIGNFLNKICNPWFLINILMAFYEK